LGKAYTYLRYAQAIQKAVCQAAQNGVGMERAPVCDG